LICSLSVGGEYAAVSPKCDAMLVRDIALVVESAILADYNPKIVSCLLHRVRVL
jgi:hypothetical protein